MSSVNILIVEDNLLVSSNLQATLTDEGYKVVVVEDGKKANNVLKNKEFQVILLDLMLPDTDGQTLLAKWSEAHPSTEIVIMTAYGDVELAVECMKKGAYDFLTKPVEKVYLLKTIENALKHSNLEKTVKLLDPRPDLGTRVIGESGVMQQTVELTRRVCSMDFSCIFIKGESGTGKGLLARTIHSMSTRRNKPFVEVNCSALPATLIESELFGHKRGAFTDAKEDKIGLFDMADGGMLFLDEIGDMDIQLQAKLLKVIEEKRFRRIGGTTELTVDVAILAATNQDVEGLIESNKFREDLFYRLNVVPVEIPPLRERKEDLPELAEFFVQMYSRKFGKDIKGFSKAAFEAITSYDWPGNVREFRNVVERGCLLTDGKEIDDIELLFPRVNSRRQESNAEFPAMTLAKAEEMVIRAAMRDAKGNKNQAAKILGVHRTTLYKKLEEYQIESDD